MDQQTNAHGESLLAVVGLDKLLSGERIRIGQGTREEALQLPVRISRELRAFLSATGFARMPALTMPGYRSVLRQVLAEPDPAARAQQFALDDHHDAATLTVALDQALAVLRPMVPRNVRDTGVTARLEAPPDFALARYARAHAVIADVMTLFGHLLAGTLLREEVRAFVGAYPSLYQQAVESVPRLLASIAAEKPRFELDGRRDRLLKVFLGAQTFDPALAARLRIPYSATSENAGGGPKPPDVAKTAQPTTDRVAAV